MLFLDVFADCGGPKELLAYIARVGPDRPPAEAAASILVDLAADGEARRLGALQPDVSGPERLALLRGAKAAVQPALARVDVFVDLDRVLGDALYIE